MTMLRLPIEYSRVRSLTVFEAPFSRIFIIYILAVIIFRIWHLYEQRTLMRPTIRQKK